MPDSPNLVEWYDSPDVHDRRRCVQWWPNGRGTPTQPLGTVYVSERETPAMTWPPSRVLADDCIVDEAHVIALEHSCQY